MVYQCCFDTGHFERKSIDLFINMWYNILKERRKNMFFKKIYLWIMGWRLIAVPIHSMEADWGLPLVRTTKDWYDPTQIKKQERRSDNEKED